MAMESIRVCTQGDWRSALKLYAWALAAAVLLLAVGIAGHWILAWGFWLKMMR